MVFVGVIQDNPPAWAVPGKDLLPDLVEGEGVVSDERSVLQHLQCGDVGQPENLHPIPRGNISEQKPGMVDEFEVVGLDPCRHLEDALGKELLIR